MSSPNILALKVRLADNRGMRVSPDTHHQRLSWTEELPRLILRAVAVLFLLVLPCTSALAQDGTSSDGGDFYGINFVQPTEPWLTIGYNSGARIVRYQFNWRDIEPSPGNFDWTLTDQAVAAWRQRGLKIHAILHNPPDYALANPSGLMPANLDAPFNSGSPSFARYCYQFANRYRGQIASYEVWNEPDLQQYWQGSPDEYFRLLKNCYIGIRAADLDPPIAMAGMAYTSNRRFTSDVIRIAANDPDSGTYNHFFDAMAIHMYGDPETVYTYTQEVRGILTQYGLGSKPIWITETNVALRGVNGVPDVPARGLGSLQEGGWYVLQASTNAWAAGASRLMFFRLADDDMLGEGWGLVHNSGQPRPGYKSLQLATSILHDITEAQREVTPEGLVITRLRRADGGRIVVVFSQTGAGAAVSVPAESSAAVLINSDGGYSPIEANNGMYNFNLPPAPGRTPDNQYLFLVGGPVILIVEFDRDPPISSIEIVPLPDDKKHVLVKWKGNDGKAGTGVASYDVEVSTDGVTWVSWQTGTTASEAIYDISAGGAFAFRVRATDRFNNVGEFSEPAAVSLRLVGVLAVRVVDLRGQVVPSARITLADGSLYDTGVDGWARIELDPGATRVMAVDAGDHGVAGPQPEVNIAVDAEVTQSVLVVPADNWLPNGGFDYTLDGWAQLGPQDATLIPSADGDGGVLRLAGHRRPWGPPAVSAALRVPPDAASALLSFRYRLARGQQILWLRAITPTGQVTLWRADAPADEMTRVWMDLSQYAGQPITISFELWGPKGAHVSSAELDDIVFGNVPVLPSLQQ